VAAAAAQLRPADPPDDYWFDEHAADAAVAFFARYLHFTKGSWYGKPFTLEPWQANDIVRPLFGWKRPDGRRRYTRCIVYLPRKNGKTELAAGLALLMLLGDGLPGGEVYALASKEDQARIVFDKAVAMINMQPQLRAILEPFKDSIYSQRFDSFFKPLDGKAKGKHGLNASGLVADELHEWRNGDLYTTVHQSEAAREEPIEFLISTAGVRGRSFGWEVWEEALKIRTGALDDPATLVVIYAAEPEDDWTAEATWHKANPNLGVSVNLDYLRAECLKAQASPRLQNDFRRYHLNQWTSQSVRWLPMKKWDECGAADWRDEAPLYGRLCYGGVDLGSTDDLTAYALAFPPAEEGGAWRRLYRVFMPEDRIEQRVEQSGVPYDRWVAAGAIFATPGDCVDYEFVVQKMLEDFERFDLRLVGFDRHNVLHVTNSLQAKGVDPAKCVKVGQGFSEISEPCKYYETQVFRGVIDHGNHPVARFCADNVMVRRDPLNRIRPDKDRSSEKIDVITADIIAEATAMRAMGADEPGDLEGFLTNSVVA
jgi:phage terminase large subunit-like protein